MKINPTLQKTIVITGASDGIGRAAARMLVADGHKVVIVGRSPTKTAAVARELGMPFYVADFNDLAQVRELAVKLGQDLPRIDVLVNNAGGIFGERTLTKDGFELTFQVNYLAGFLLTELLLPTLLRSRAVVIQTASVASWVFGDIDIHDLQNEKHYSANKAYGDSKAEQILFTRELHRRYAGQGIKAVSFHPGNLATGFAGTSSSWLRFIYHSPLKRFIGKAETGGKALKWLIDSVPGADWQPGEYYQDNRIARKMNPQTKDMKLANELWQQTERLLVAKS